MPDSFFVPPKDPAIVADKFFNIVKQKNVYITVILNDRLAQLYNTLLFGIDPFVKDTIIDRHSKTMILGNFSNDDSGESQIRREACILAMLLMTEGHNVFVGTLDKRCEPVLLPAYELYEDHIDRIAEERASR